MSRAISVVGALVLLALTAPQAAQAITFTQGTYIDGLLNDSTTAPPGTAYNFTDLAKLFTTNFLAYQWGYVDDGNPTPQDAASVKGFVESWTGLALSDVVNQWDELSSGTDFSSSDSNATHPSVSANVYAVHFGQGELVFIFKNPVVLALSDWTGKGLSDFRAYDATIASEVPLPAALPLFASGVAGIGALGWRKRRRKAA